MQIQPINSNNQTFGATLKIRNRSRESKMERSIINFLEKEFPKRTKGIKGHLDLSVGFSSEVESLFTRLKYSNGKHKRYKDMIEIVELPKQKEELLNGLVNSLKGFIIREKAQNKIGKLKREIIDVSDKAYSDSERIFNNQFVCYRNLINHEIAPKGAPFDIRISRR